MTNDLKKWLNKKESSKEIVTDSLIQKYKACLSADVDVKNLLGLHWCLTQPKECGRQVLLVFLKIFHLLMK